MQLRGPSGPPLLLVTLLCLLVLRASVCALSSYEESALVSGKQFIDDYHFPMVADEVRNGLFYAALKQTVVPGVSKVLDVGAGTMLLSMMAADLGAASVLGVEANPVMGGIAAEVLSLNNYTDDPRTGRIRLHVGRFEDVKRSQELIKWPADVLVSETFDAGLIGENFLSILAHAKTEKLISANTVVIPHAATVYAQLLESTFSLQRPADSATDNVTTTITSGQGDRRYRFEGPDGSFRMGMSLEPMRHRRVANTYTVRYLGEKNAVRQQLSAPMALFDYNFQDFDVRVKDFAYSCVIFTVTAASEGVLDSIGLFFNLYLDRNKTIIVSNAPSAHPDSTGQVTMVTAGEELHFNSNSAGTGIHQVHGAQTEPAACWMQALYRLNTDVFVRRGDIVRIQAVQQGNVYVFGDVGVGRHNQWSRLVKFTAVGCVGAVTVYTGVSNPTAEAAEEEDSEEEVDPASLREYLGEIPAGSSSNGNSNPFKVFSGKVGQQFKLTTTLVSGRRLGMLYRIPGSRRPGSKAVSRRQIRLDSFDVVCPNQ